MMITFDKKQFEDVNNPEGYSNYVKEREEKEKREKERKQSEKIRAVLKDMIIMIEYNVVRNKLQHLYAMEHL